MIERSGGIGGDREPDSLIKPIEQSQDIKKDKNPENKPELPKEDKQGDRADRFEKTEEKDNPHPTYDKDGKIKP